MHHTRRSLIIEEQRQVEGALRDQVASLSHRLREEQQHVQEGAAREAHLMERVRALETNQLSLSQDLEAVRQERVQAGVQAKVAEDEHRKVCPASSVTCGIARS
jgi:hypothetical protein